MKRTSISDIRHLRDVPTSFRLVALALSGLRRGRLDMRLPDGRILPFGGDLPGPSAEMTVVDYAFARRALTSGDIGFAEGYMEGEFDTPDLAAVLAFFSANFDAASQLTLGNVLDRFANLIRHALRANTRAGSRRNILAHYDLGNAFYARWLDPTMTYSSAVFEQPGQSLEEAQLVKYRRLAQNIDLKPGDHVLEIGSGWGGFAEVAAKEYGAKVTSVTISDAQHAFASKRIFEAGLADKVDIQLRDYRDIEGRFNSVASIEMFEAVGEKYWPRYFGKVSESLVSGGRAALQVITIDDAIFRDYRTRSDFIQRYIFPGGMLPSVSRLKEEAVRAGLRFDASSMFGQSYADTLAQWSRRFLGAWDDIRGLGFDERFRRMWLYYLAYCEAGFRTGRIDVGQFVLSKA